ncbi:NAD(P)-dependent oxidoreductase [Bradyrhizobium sp. Ec3.3]|uniref:NAD-dependent epimerase/dehydratase family protein n=1 Tax=Bradyrhizobium sp. Ec3.3 TaxID=189753 RepID=UPI000485EEAD|nr:SDR family oxidoreductase [Bradyrhizobium sp. Ec3.3]
MRVLITGNMGYVGSVLTRFLKSKDPGIEIMGYDSGFFGHCLTGAESIPEACLTRQYIGDVRELTPAILDEADAVVHLAAVSNDPMGKEFEDVTTSINREASVRIAKIAASHGVGNFVFASSCSVYGAAVGWPRGETDTTNPLTPYARSKIGTEDDLRQIDLSGMVFTSLRFATACGMSDRLRLDLVLNDLVACAVSSGEINVLSDGSPWRPLIDVEDMARAIYWAIRRRAEDGGTWLAVNAGRDESNYKISDLAEAVQRQVSNAKVSINADAPSDKRSYKVDFSLFKSLAPDFIPRVSLDQSIARLLKGLERMKFVDRKFRNSPYLRLNTLRRHIDAGRLNRDLRWLGM